jgi:hypothetical protein
MNIRAHATAQSGKNRMLASFRLLQKTKETDCTKSWRDSESPVTEIMMGECKQVFWLRGQSTHSALPAQLSQRHDGTFVARYSGATVWDLHPVPYSPAQMRALAKPLYIVGIGKNKCAIWGLRKVESTGNFQNLVQQKGMPFVLGSPALPKV